MRKLHWTPSEGRDTLPFLETVILLAVIGLIVFLFKQL